jgi:protein O-GlcNAc transferase
MNSKTVNLVHQAILHFNQGDWVTAETHLIKALRLHPSNADALHLLGYMKGMQGDHQAAIKHLGRAALASPNNPEIHLNLGKALDETGDFESAFDHFRKASQLKKNNISAWLGYGKAAKELKKHHEAIACYEQAIQIDPRCAEAWLFKATILSIIKRYDEALSNYDQAIQLKPDYAEAWCFKGGTLCELKRYEEALVHCKNAYSLKPTLDFLLGHLTNSQMHLCEWNGFEKRLAQLADRVDNSEKVIYPFNFLSMSDSPHLQLKVAKTWGTTLDNLYPTKSCQLALPNNRDKKIRIGYFSGDFSSHAVSVLTAELFEIHDRNRFEIFAFSFNQATPDDAMRNRLIHAFDRFIDLQDLSDQEAITLARDFQIDIAVDLAGHTANSRTVLFANRVAPVQVNYLGFPATMGVEYIDYIIADRHLIPDNTASFYSEKIVYLPYCFQSNDTKRTISDRSFTRTELGLPDEGFIFCSFNNNHKLNPVIFDSWMRILKKLEASYLWLLATSRTVEINLRNEAQKRGINPDRLIFGGPLPLPEYLARYRQADLFLDTLPFNAGTTASDALWAGLPVLTCSGQSFAGRMATSLLHAIELPELITQSLDEYENLAIELATNPDKLKAIRQKLANNRLTTPLFDIKRFTRDIESAYTKMYERHQANLPPEAIHIER